MIDLDQARQDLEDKPPEVWARLYASALLAELEESKKQRVKTALILQRSTKTQAGLRKVLRDIMSHIAAFEKASGWSRKDHLKKRKRLPTTQNRWRAAQAFAHAVNGTIALFHANSFHANSSVDTGISGKRIGGKFADVLSKLEALAQAAKSGDLEKAKAALDRMLDQDAEAPTETVSESDPAVN